MNLRRLAGMPLDVAADRARQEIARRVDRLWTAPAMARLAWARPRRLAPERFRLAQAAAGGRFFAGALQAGIPESAPGGAAARILASANDCRAGRFDFLGYEKLSYGRPIDWHRDPVCGPRAPQAHWSLIDPLDVAQVGDSKVVWELNRHQWLVRLGQAYRLDGDTRNAEAFAAAVRDWMRENPPGIGINWASSLEVAMRLIAWCWARALFRDAPALTVELERDMLAWIGIHAAHIECYLSRSFSPNTHLTGEALGLYYAGTAFPVLDAGGRWRRRGRAILLRELSRQVHEDGVYFEQSTCYQRYTVEIYLHFILLSRLNGEALPAFAAERVQGMVDWLVAMQHPDGSMPRIGDEDGGWLLPLVPRAADDYRGVFAVAAAVFRRADYAWAARGETGEVTWLMGRAGARILAELSPRPPRGPASRSFPRGGYVVMRDAWRHDAHQLIMDAGPIGCPHSAGHGHADLLSIQCAAFGHPVLVDAGTYCYTQDPAWREYLRGTFAHNTATIDGMGQAATAGPFRWRTRPAARLNVWHTQPDADYADAEHDAFLSLTGGVRHRRRVLFAKPDFWVVVDDFTGGGVHEVRLHYQFAPAAQLRQLGGWSLATLAAGPGLIARVFAPVGVTSTVRSGALDPLSGWVSEGYGKRVPAPLLDYRVTSDLPLRLVTLLVPAAHARVAAPAAEVEFREGGLCRIRVGGREILVTDEALGIEAAPRNTAAASTGAVPREPATCAP